MAQGKPIGVAVLEALGLPASKCLSLTLEFKPSSVVIARAEYHAEGLDAETVEVIRQWCASTEQGEGGASKV